MPAERIVECESSETGSQAMKAILVRIGVDHSYGNWNAPADPDSRRFVYVPIPEKVGTRFHRGCKRSFREVVPTLSRFTSEFGLDLAGIGWPKDLEATPLISIRRTM